MRLKSFLVIVLTFLFLSEWAFAGNKINEKIYNGVSLSNKFYVDKTEALLTKTGQETTYRSVALDDDGALELGIAPRYTVLTTGQYAGSTNVTINSKTLAISNACVLNNNTGNMFLRAVAQSVIGPAADGKLFWGQYTLAGETCTCNATNKTITADAGTPFSTGALCTGRIFTILGSALGNNGTFTVTNITTSVITVSEAVVDEASIPLDFATVDDLIWNFKDQANIPPGIAGYTDWRIPNWRELASIINSGYNSPAVDTTVFPSTPSSYHWVSTTDDTSSGRALSVFFTYGTTYYANNKQTTKWYVRLVR